MNKIFRTSLLVIAAVSMVFTSCKKDPVVEPKATYVVTFDAQNGSAVTTVEVEDGALVTKPTDPVREGYTFNGWYKEAAGTTAWNFATDVVTASITLYAKWTEDGPVGPVLPDEPGVYITFGNETEYKAAEVRALLDSEQETIRITAGKTTLTAYPRIDFWIPSYVTDGEILPLVEYRFEYYETGSLQDANNIIYGDWWSDYQDNPSEMTIIKNQDGLLTARAEVTMFNARERYVEQNPDYPRQTLTIILVDVPYSEGTVVEEYNYDFEDPTVTTQNYAGSAFYESTTAGGVPIIDLYIVDDPRTFMANIWLIPNQGATTIDGTYPFPANVDDLAYGNAFPSPGGTATADRASFVAVNFTPDGYGAAYYLVGGSVTISGTNVTVAATSYFGSTINITGSNLAPMPTEAPSLMKSKSSKSIAKINKLSKYTPVKLTVKK